MSLIKQNRRAGAYRFHCVGLKSISSRCFLYWIAAEDYLRVVDQHVELAGCDGLDLFLERQHLFLLGYVEVQDMDSRMIQMLSSFVW
jgi:hypothetical protein